jgi:acetyl esterase
MSIVVDPDMVPILAAMRAAGPFNYASVPIAEARAAFDRGAEFWRPFAPDIPHIGELTLPGATGPMRARLYRPHEGRLPVIIFVHGGGWTFGSLDTHENEMRHLALSSGAAVLGFDYRLAPEHPFPAPLEDVLAVIAAIRRGVLGDNIDHGRWALAGDSAGANLALGALLALRDAKEPNANAAVLYYGCFAPLFDTESHKLFGGGDFGLSSERMRWYWRNFLGGKLDGAAVHAMPLEADIADLPPLRLIAAGLDPLRDDTLALSNALDEIGAAHEIETVPGVIHGFLRNAARLPSARRSLDASGAFLTAHFK